ncbi:MAG TPA: IPTL-CTERM sorting domain-containing protein [Casimicrobiaceae bacterium]|nr:IPTL-CTERM sorting domain-containing protein [Casimicrobiaceae bacterium]
MAFGVTVTTDASTITVPTCAPFSGGGGITDIPTLSQWAMIALAGLVAIAGFAAMRRRQAR